MAIKIFDLHLVEYQQGQKEPCFFPKLLPKGILLLQLLLFEQAVCFLLNIKGRAQGPDLQGCLRAGPLSSDFRGAGSSFWRQVGDLLYSTNTPEYLQESSHKHSGEQASPFVTEIVRAENPRPNKRAGFSSSKHHTSLFFFFFFLLLFTCCSLCSTNNVLFKPGQKTLSVFRAWCDGRSQRCPLGNEIKRKSFIKILSSQSKGTGGTKITPPDTA